ncbi:MAG: hypothetical protein D4R70_00410, partial [Betaproteobacteria bacterium]
MRALYFTPRLLPVFAILVAAPAWGAVWYPYRVLNAGGLGGGLASILTYLPGLLLLWWLNGRCSGEWRHLWRGLLFLA